MQGKQMTFFVAKFTKCLPAVGHGKGSLQRTRRGCSPWRAERRRPWRPVPVTSEHLLPTAVRGSASWPRRTGTLCPRRRVTSTPGPRARNPSSVGLGVPARVILHHVHAECLWALSWAVQISIWGERRRVRREPDWLRPVHKANGGVSLLGAADHRGRSGGGNRSSLAEKRSVPVRAWQNQIVCHASFLVINGEAIKEGGGQWGRKLAARPLDVTLQTTFSATVTSANFISVLNTWGKSSTEDTSSRQTSASCAVAYQQVKSRSETDIQASREAQRDWGEQSTNQSRLGLVKLPGLSQTSASLPFFVFLFMCLTMQRHQRYSR